MNFTLRVFGVDFLEFEICRMVLVTPGEHVTLEDRSEISDQDEPDEKARFGF